MPKKPNETKKIDGWREHWRNFDAWTVREFAQLCCGWNPTIYEFPDRDIYAEALERINRAVRVKVIPTIDDLAWPATPAEQMYDAVPAFRPRDVAAWGAAHYPGRFPFAASDFAQHQRPGADDAVLPTRLRELLQLVENTPVGTSQKALAARIEEHLKVHRRDAQAYAALVRSDESAAGDRRAAWRRESSKSLDDK